MKSDHNLIVNILLGIAGAVVLNALLFWIVGGTLGGIIGQLIIAVIGACLLIWVYRLVKSRT